MPIVGKGSGNLALSTIDITMRIRVMNNPAPGHERGDPEFLIIRSVLSARFLVLSQSVSVFLCGSQRIPRILCLMEVRKTPLVDWL
jgi:hypothetical protein